MKWKPWILLIILFDCQPYAYPETIEQEVALDGSVSRGFKHSVVNISFTGYQDQGHNISLSFKNVPRPIEWKNTQGLFTLEQERNISDVRLRDSIEHPDIELRFGYPIDLTPSQSGGVVVTFATSENEVTKNMLTTYSPLWSEVNDDVTIMTPSTWSANQLILLGGVPQHNLYVLPHGIDPDTFHPPTNNSKLSEECKDFRRNLNIPQKAFIFLHIGAGTKNKNINFILEAFKRIRGQYPLASLILKTISDLYEHELPILDKLLGSYKWATDELVWLDGTFSMNFMGKLYRCADIYLSPYSSEGFNLPVLESLASGTPAIVSRHGSTDDFTKSDFTRYIQTKVIEDRYEVRNGKLVPTRRYLLVDNESLYEEMLYVIRNYTESSKKSRSWVRQAGILASEFAHTYYTWEMISRTLFDYVLKKLN